MTGARQFTANVIAQGLARVLSIAANLVLVLAVARLMGAERFGNFSYVLAFINIAVALADLGTTAVLARGLALHEGDARAHYLGNFILMRCLLAAAVMLGGLIAAWLMPHGVQAALLVAALGVPVLASRFFEPIYQVYGRPWLSLWSNLSFGLSQLLVALAVWQFPHIGVTPVTVGYVASNALYTAVAFGLMRRLVRPRWRPDARLLRAIIAVAAPLGVGAMFTTLAIRADILALEHFRSSVEMGYYSAAYRILDIAVFFAVTLVTPLIPILSREIASDPAGALRRSRMFVQFACILALPVAIVVPTVAVELVTLVFGAAYAPAAAPLAILVWDVVLIVLALIGSAINLANGEVDHAYWVAPGGAALSVALNLWLVPPFGMVGAAWAALGCQVGMLIASQYYTLARFGNIYEPRAWRRIALACAGLSLALLLLQPVGAVLAAVLALLVYAGLVVRLKLLPIQLLRLLRDARAARRRPTP